MKTKHVYNNCYTPSNSFRSLQEIRRRQYGLKPKIGNPWIRTIYDSYHPAHTWHSNDASSGVVRHVTNNEILAPSANWDEDRVDAGGYGGIFNLEFSHDGHILVAACQKKAILLFDPVSLKQIEAIPDAHNDCVNGIKFLDNRLFASCSDDLTVALWDIRNVKNKLHSLVGHSKWVKNIEYHHQDGKIVSSGFDGDILSWDINSFNDGTPESTKLVNMKGLMRMKISPDLNKLLLCTSSGYILLVQNLDLEHFTADMEEFMNLEVGSQEDEQRVVGRHRNRPIIIKDFPNDAKMVHSMQVHPHSWAVVSRNTSISNRSEWTCVHDIQEIPVASDVKEEDNSTYSSDGRKKLLRNILEKDYLDYEDEDDSRMFVEQPTVMSYESNNDSPPRIDFALNSRGNNFIFFTRRNFEREEPEVEDLGDEDEDNNNNMDLSLSDEEFDEILQDPLDFDRGRVFAESMRVLMQNIRPEEAEGEREGVEEENREERPVRRGGRGRGEEPERPIDLIANRIRSYRRRPSSHALSSSRWRTQMRRYLEEDREGDGRRRRRPAGIDQPDEEDRAFFEGMDPLPTVRNRIFHAYSILTRRVSNSLRSRLLDIVSQRKTIINFPTTYCNNYLSKDLAVREAFSQQRPRLTHYFEEANIGRGYIKEVGFNTDGRIMCSPYKNGVRLVMFDQQCGEMNKSVSLSDVTMTPKKLTHMKNVLKCHPDNVVSAKFSPTQHLFVSGCLGGKIIWHQPQL